MYLAIEGAAVEKEDAQAALADAMALEPPTLAVDDVLGAIERFGGIGGVLEHATTEERAALYASIGVSAVYDSHRNKSAWASTPLLQQRVGGGT